MTLRHSRDPWAFGHAMLTPVDIDELMELGRYSDNEGLSKILSGKKERQWEVKMFH